MHAGGCVPDRIRVMHRLMQSLSTIGAPVAAVIGRPIVHSRSPRLHGHWLRRYAVDGHYIPLSVPDEAALVGFLRLLPGSNLVGCNVTVPFKIAAASAMDVLTPRAARAGAVNTVTRLSDDTLCGDNTDGEGFLNALHEAGVNPRGAEVLLLGAGGAAAGIVPVLLDAGALPMIYNRTPESARQLAERSGAQSCTGADLRRGRFQLLVNTFPDSAAAVPFLPYVSGTVFDVNYGKTELIGAATGPAVDGLRMLMHQAVPGFEAWFGVRPDADEEAYAAIL